MDAIKISIHGRLTVGNKYGLLVYLSGTKLLWSWLALTAWKKKRIGLCIRVMCFTVIPINTSSANNRVT
uniref:Uncharacterized protein n=1 Tax=Glossina palpalis gambiensis TaxID=67801 RepID=A0A1B0B5Y7_9MUSC